MSTNNTKTSDAAGSKTPSHIVYHVRDIESGKGFFTRCGAAWAHKDEKGFSVLLDGLVPLGGKLTLRVASEKR